MADTVLKIEGMTWGHCAASVTRALKAVAGVNDVRVDLGDKQAVISHSGADIEKMKAAVDDAGYEVVSVK